MAQLIEIATRIQDLYYQNYTPNDKFLDIDDFLFWTATTYSSMLNSLYQAQRRENKQMEGFSNIEISSAWLLEEILTLEYSEEDNRYYAFTKEPIFSFDFDGAANSLQGIHSVGKKHCNFRKISLNERRFRGIIPPAGVIFYYLNSPKEIVFWGANDNGACGCDKGMKVKTQYIPQIVGQRNDCLLSDNIVSALTDEVLKRMFAARSGNMIDKTDDQNPNMIPAQQVNQSLPKQ